MEGYACRLGLARSDSEQVINHFLAIFPVPVVI